MQSLFWRLAFKLYARCQPRIGFELFTIGGVGAIALLGAVAVFMNPTPANIIRLVDALAVVGIGIAHRRVGIERQKGAMALYEKAFAAER